MLFCHFIRIPKQISFRIFLLLFCVSHAGCLPYSPVSNPASTLPLGEQWNVETSLEFEQNSSSKEFLSRSQAFWKAFEDPHLEALIQKALSDNFQIKMAWARLRRSKAFVDQASAGYWPQLGVDLSGSIGESPNAAIGNSRILSLSASAPVSYELDLFQRIGAQVEAAEFDEKASKFDTQTMAITIAAELADAWFGWLESKRRLSILSSQKQSALSLLELVELRFEQGLNTIVDVYQQRQQVSSVESQYALAEGQLVSAESRLLSLIADPQFELAQFADADFPSISLKPDIGIPSDLLQMRPDILAAQKRVEAADFRVGAAIASRFPSVRIQASVGYSFLRVTAERPTTVDENGDGLPDDLDGDMIPDTVTREVSRNTDGFNWNVGLNISVPLFDGGLRSAQTEVQRANVEEALAGFEQAVNQAWVEVRSALAMESANQSSDQKIEIQFQNAKASFDAARERFNEGLVDFLQVLTVEQAYNQVELARLSSKRTYLSSLVQLFRALGGTWPSNEVDAKSQ